MAVPTDRTQEAQPEAEVHPLELMHEAMVLEYEARAEEDNEENLDAQYCYQKYIQAAELYEKAFVLLVVPNYRLWSNLGIRLTQSYAAAAYYLNDDLDYAEQSDKSVKEKVTRLDAKAARVAFVLLSSNLFVTEAREDLLSWLGHSDRRGALRLRTSLICWLTGQIAETTMAEFRWDAVTKKPWERVRSLVLLAKLNTVLAEVADTGRERIAANAAVLRILMDLNELQEKESLRESA